jgi:hypothetical protein
VPPGSLCAILGENQLFEEGAMRGTIYKILVLAVFISFIPGLLGFQDSDTYNQEYDHYEKAEAEKRKIAVRNRLYSWNS